MAILTESKTIKVRTGCGSVYVTFLQGDRNIFISSGKTGHCVFANLESVARLATLLLEKGASFEEIAKQLTGIRCSTPSFFGKVEILSCSDAVAHAIRIYLEDKKNQKEEKKEEKSEIINNANNDK